MLVEDLYRTIMDKIRSTTYRLKGTVIGAKVRIGPRTRIDLPWQVEIGERVTIESDVWLKLVSDKARLNIGKYTFLGRGAEINVNKSVTIGDHVLVSPGVFITDHTHNIHLCRLIDSQGCTSRIVIVEDDCWLGAYSIIMPGVHIGKGAVVGAGSVVTRNVASNTIVAGNPAKLLRRR